MNYEGAWADIRYLRKKAHMQSQHDLEAMDGWLPSQREIMPECVLELVRELYPNLKGVPYMGHKFYWQINAETIAIHSFTDSDNYTCTFMIRLWQLVYADAL